MAKPSDSPNIVDLQQRQNHAAEADRLGDLLKRIRGTSLQRLGELIGTLFENVDDALFDLAERAGSNALQTRYFDGMREIRKKRQLVERVFLEQMKKAFSDFAEGKLKAIRIEVQPQASGGLSLVDDTELEESLAVTSMVSKSESRLQRVLYQLNQRLAVLVGGSKVEDASNPIGPAVLGNAFRTAVRELEIDVQVKLIVYKLYDRYVMSGLEPAYEDVNRELIEAGVLPHMQHAATRGTPVQDTHAAPAPGVEPASYERVAADSEIGANAESGELQKKIYDTLRSLLGARQADPGFSSNRLGRDEPGYQSLPGFSGTELLAALTILQQAQSTIAGAPTELPDATAEASPLQVKREIATQAGRLVAGERRVSNADEDTIDLVGMLFEYIVRDRNLPAQVQAVLGRLQIPYLKVAILDKHLFAQRSHPARQLLDTLAEAGKGWTEEADRDHALLNQIVTVVETVLRDFDDDVQLFERELEKFREFTTRQGRRAELAEQRAADATRGREKLHHARTVAAREILKRVDHRQLPPIIHMVLSRPWANYLVLTMLRQGEDSDEWRNGLRFADEFVWSAHAKNNDADRSRLRTLLPHLEKALRHGLTTVAYHDNDIKRLMQELGHFYRQILDGESVETRSAREVIEENSQQRPTDAAPTASAAEQPAGPLLPPSSTARSPVEEAILNPDSAELLTDFPPPVEAQEDEFAKIVRDLKVGAWFDFMDEAGKQERAKLSWISPISGKYLFVNRRGLKVCDKTFAVLAGELREGKAALLEEVPLFDRALDAIVARLRDNTGVSAASSGPAADPPSRP